MLKITKYIAYDILRSRVLIAYTIFLWLIAMALFAFESDSSRSVASLLSIVLIIVPMVSIIFATTYFYNSYQFIELLAAQPIQRRVIILGAFSGVSISLLLSFSFGIGIPVLLYSLNTIGFVLLVSGCSLTLIFTAIAFLVAVHIDDKAKGIGLAMMAWFYFGVIYDALVLAILFAFSEYPLEKAVVALASFNPIDLVRILVLMKLDVSALMGFTGAVYKEFFGTFSGFLYISVVLSLWLLVPLVFTVRRFSLKNI
ncbi:MAG: ABC transporter permease [Chitinophagales bacterium]